MNNDMRLAFEAFCKRTASPGASSSEYYWMLFQAGAAYNDALAARLAELESRQSTHHCENCEATGQRLAEAERDAEYWKAEHLAGNRRIDEAEALLRETRERMNEAETTARVLTGQLPQYSEGQQMLSSLATRMGDSAKRIRAFLTQDSASDALQKFASDLADAQRPLDPEVARVLYENKESLYMTDTDQPPSSASVEGE